MVATIGELQRALAERPDAERLFELLLELLGHQGLRYDGACWHVDDPLTGLFTSIGVVGELPGDYRTAIELELFTDDVAKIHEVAARPVPVASLVAETEGRPESSPRWREMISPSGHADELRAVFVDEFGRWGSINLFRAGRPFEQRDRELVATAAPQVAQALRVAAAAGPAPGIPVPGVLVVDKADRVDLADPTARTYLVGRDEELPGTVHVLAARVRHQGRSLRARMHTDDGWLILDGMPLEDGPGRVAVVVQPAPSASVVDVRLLAAGLSEREREVALAVIRGESTRRIAAALFLSPWTVQDHLKAVFEKTGVGSRRELVAQFTL